MAVNQNMAIRDKLEKIFKLAGQQITNQIDDKITLAVVINSAEDVIATATTGQSYIDIPTGSTRFQRLFCKTLVATTEETLYTVPAGKALFVNFIGIRTGAASAVTIGMNTALPADNAYTDDIFMFFSTNDGLTSGRLIPLTQPLKFTGAVKVLSNTNDTIYFNLIGYLKDE